MMLWKANYQSRVYLVNSFFTIFWRVRLEASHGASISKGVVVDRKLFLVRKHSDKTLGFVRTFGAPSQNFV